MACPHHAEEGAEVTSGFRFKDLRGEAVLLSHWEPIVAALRATKDGCYRK